MAEVLPWRQSSDAPATLPRTVQALAEGGLVAFPTETTYVLAARADLAPAVEAVLARARPSPEPPLTLAVSGPDHAFELLPAVSPVGRRLARRCWPGPVTPVYAGDALASARAPDPVARR